MITWNKRQDDLDGYYDENEQDIKLAQTCVPDAKPTTKSAEAISQYLAIATDEDFEDMPE